jgi:hypothetical protein
MTNDLVAAPKNETEWYTGISQFEEISSLSDSIDSGSWLEVAVSGSGLGMDAMTLVFDPVGALGILVQAGLGWIIEHVKPLKQTLDDLAGDPPVIKSYGETWKNVANRLKTVAAQHPAEAKADLGGWTGPAATKYHGKAKERADTLNAASRACATVGDAVIKAGGAVATVRMLVRDTLTGLVAALIQACLPPGGGTVKAVGMIAKAGSKIAQYVGKLTRSLAKLGEQLSKLAQSMNKLIRRLRTKPGGASPVTRPSSVGRPPKPGDGPTTTPRGAPPGTRPQSGAPGAPPTRLDGDPGPSGSPPGSTTTPSDAPMLAKGRPLGTGAGRGEPPNTETIRQGTVRMEDHPRYQRVLDDLNRRGFRPTFDHGEDAPRVVIRRVVDENGNVIRVEREVRLVPGMRFLDLEHEVGHVDQVTDPRRFPDGPAPTDVDRELPDGRVRPGLGDDLAGNHKSWQNAIMEYHVRLEEFIRLANRGVDDSVLREHADGLDEWSDEYWRKGLNVGLSPSKAAWAEERFPEIGDLRQQAAAIRARLGV